MKVGIVGLGLIGGSFAKAYQEAGHEVLAFDRDESVLSFAQLEGAVSAPLTKENIGTCDLVLVAIYPEAAVNYVRDMAPYIGTKPMVIDCCGTKRVVCEACFPLAEQYRFTYLGGHPMAGTQYSGFGHARANLYHNAPMVIVPPAFDNIELLSRVQELLRPAGFGSYSVTTAEKHDEMIAFLSQLTHCIAVTLMCCNNMPDLEYYTGDSFRDLTRIARINDEMWSELFLDNKDMLLAEMRSFKQSFEELYEKIETGDRDRIREMMRLSTERRKRFNKHL